MRRFILCAIAALAIASPAGATIPVDGGVCPGHPRASLGCPTVHGPYFRPPGHVVNPRP